MPSEDKLQVLPPKKRALDSAGLEISQDAAAFLGELAAAGQTDLLDLGASHARRRTSLWLARAGGLAAVLGGISTVALVLVRGSAIDGRSVLADFFLVLFLSPLPFLAIDSIAVHYRELEAAVQGKAVEEIPPPATTGWGLSVALPVGSLVAAVGLAVLNAWMRGTAGVFLGVLGVLGGFVYMLAISDVLLAGRSLGAALLAAPGEAIRKLLETPRVLLADLRQIAGIESLDRVPAADLLGPYGAVLMWTFFGGTCILGSWVLLFDVPPESLALVAFFPAVWTGSLIGYYLIDRAFAHWTAAYLQHLARRRQLEATGDAPASLPES